MDTTIEAWPLWKKYWDGGLSRWFHDSAWVQKAHDRYLQVTLSMSWRHPFPINPLSWIFCPKPEILGQQISDTEMTQNHYPFSLSIIPTGGARSVICQQTLGLEAPWSQQHVDSIPDHYHCHHGSSVLLTASDGWKVMKWIKNVIHDPIYVAFKSLRRLIYSFTSPTTL